MTEIVIVAPITTLASGKMILEDQDTSKITVKDVKVQILDHIARSKVHFKQPPSDLTIEQLRLWWKGYLLDDSELTIDRACAAVEQIQSSDDPLIIFVVEYLDDGMNSSIPSTEDHPITASSLARGLSLRKFRSNSFDLRFLQSEIRQKKDELQMKFCTLL